MDILFLGVVKLKNHLPKSQPFSSQMSKIIFSVKEEQVLRFYFQHQL